MPLSTLVKRTGEVVPFDRDKIRLAIYKATAAVGRHDDALADRTTRQVLEALAEAYSEDEAVTVEDVQDLVERVLIRSGEADLAKAYILYRHERSRLRSGRRTAGKGNIPYKAMWQALDWAVDHGCHTVAALNRTIEEGRLPDLIDASERRYADEIAQAAESLLARRDEVRFLIVAGPSSSGKTTTTHKIAERLSEEGIPAVPLALDNYFFDLELHPGDEFGDRDFETPEALDLTLINEHLAQLDAGDPISMPIYDFKTGNRRETTVPFEVPAGSVIVLDTLHGLYDGLTASVPESRKFRLYIETISQIKDESGRYVRWTDLRMLRRMSRDALFRGYSPEKTILHWHYVRRSELKHIIPHQGNADLHVNGALAYELPFLKQRCFAELPSFLERWQDDDRRLDGYIRAQRVYDLLESIADVAGESAVPDDSVLREFIGGGSLDVHTH